MKPSVTWYKYVFDMICNNLHSLFYYLYSQEKKNVREYRSNSGNKKCNITV